MCDGLSVCINYSVSYMFIIDYQKFIIYYHKLNCLGALQEFAADKEEISNVHGKPVRAGQLEIIDTAFFFYLRNYQFLFLS